MTWIPIIPNWSNGIREGFAFVTSVFVTDDGHEQRRSKVVRPRRSIELAALIGGPSGRLLADAIEGAKDGQVEAPDYAAEPGVVRAPSGTDTSLLRLAAAPGWLGHSMPAALIVGRAAYAVDIDVAAGATVTLSSSLPVDVPAGAVLLPRVSAALGETSLEMHAADVATATLRLDVRPGTPQRSPDADVVVRGTDEMLLGRHILMRSPNYLAAPQQGFGSRAVVVDYGRGVTRAFTPVPMIRRTFTATYLGRQRETVMALLDVFLRARGRAGEVYVPSWGRDFPQPSSAAGGDLTFAGRTLFETYGASLTHRAVLILGTDGSVRAREVRRIYLADGDSRVEFDSGVGISVNNIDKICWMFVARFAQDELILEWVTDEIANVTMSFVMLHNLPIEDLFASNWILDTHFWRDIGQWEDTAEWKD